MIDRLLARVTVFGGLFVFGLLIAPLAKADIKVGDTLPDCSKIPLISIDANYRPQPSGGASLESDLLFDGVAIVHFCSPRPQRGSAFQTAFVEELSDLRKAAQSVPYPCRAVAVVPLGEKGRQDAMTLLDASPEKPWGDISLFYEPTYPRPGVYRTFHPGASGVADSGKAAGDIATPWTYLIGPGRKVLAIRAPDSKARLYEWLQENLPANVIAVPKPPSSTLSLPEVGIWNWPTFRRTAPHAPLASTLPDVLPYTYLAWQTTIGRTFASPAVVDNVVYVNSDSKGLQSLALATGQPLLAFQTGASWWNSPVVAGRYVYSIGAQGTLFAIDRGTFVVKWKRDLGGLVTSSPIVSDGALYVGSRNGSVYAVDATNGDVLWQFQTGGEISSSPALMNGVLVIGSGDRNVYAIDFKTGALKWSAITDGPVDSSPTIAGGDVLIGSFDGGLYSFKFGDGTLNWRCQLGGWVHSSPAVSEDTVFVGTVNFPRSEIASFNWIDLKTGKRKGNFDMPDAVYSSPTVWGDLVLVGSRDRQLYAFDRKMRQTQPAWTYRTRSYVHASPVVVGDTVLVASFDGDLYALRQAKPIRTWTDGDIIPRWFVAAISQELQKQVAELIDKAASGQVGGEHKLRACDEVYVGIKAGASKPGVAPKVLPRDVPGEHPGASYVAYVLTAGLLAGYPDGTFKPNDPTTRYQFSYGLATVVQSVTRPDFAWKELGDRAAKGAAVEVRIEPAPGRPRTMPRDVPGDHWANKALAELAGQGLVPIDEEAMFRGGKNLTLKDAAAQWNLFVESLKVVRTK